MSTFKSWSKLFVLVLLVFVFAGCGGGGGGTSTTPTSDTITWYTAPNPTPTTPVTPEPSSPEPTPEPVTPTPEPTTPEPVTPEPTQPTPEPIQPEPVSSDPVQPEPTQPEPVTPEPEPTPEPSTGDTYDIASVLEGTWNGISGSGMTINTPIIGLLMSQLSISFTRPQTVGGISTTYITQQQYWNYTDGEQIYQATLNGDNVQNNITHIGADTWRFNSLDGTIITITLTSDITAEVTQEGSVTINGYIWQYNVNYALHKEASYETNALSGNWGLTTPYSAGIGTATSGSIGSNYDLLELRVSSANLSFSETIAPNMSITHRVNFGAYSNSIYMYSVSPSYPKEIVSVQQLENDTFQYRLKGYDPISNISGSTSSVTVQIKLTSDTTAEVTETGHFRLSGRLYTYNVFYKLTKQ